MTAAGLPFVEATVGSDGKLGRLASQARFMAKMMRDQRSSKAARGSQFCEVRVDADTGEVQISRWLGVFDVGRIINPNTARQSAAGRCGEGHRHGAVRADPRRPAQRADHERGFDNYHLPVHADVPPIGVSRLGEPDPTMPLGLLGLGEVAEAGVAAAIANAVFRTTGKRIPDLPVTLDKPI